MPESVLKPRSTSALPLALVLDRQQAILLVPLLYLCDKQNVRRITTRQICSVVIAFANSIRESGTGLAGALPAPLAPTLSELLKRLQLTGSVEKGAHGYFLRTGFIKKSSNAIENRLSEEEIREAHEHTNGLCRAYFKAA